MEDISDILRQIIENQRIMCKNLVMIYDEIMSLRREVVGRKGEEFLLNYAADIAGIITEKIGEGVVKQGR